MIISDCKWPSGALSEVRKFLREKADMKHHWLVISHHKWLLFSVKETFYAQFQVHNLRLSAQKHISCLILSSEAALYSPSV